MVSLWPGFALACDNAGLPMISLDKEAPRVELSLEGMQLSQPFSVEIKLCGDAHVKTLSVDAIMPAHQHGMKYTPTIVDLGDGMFRVDGMLFHMPGVWEIQVDVVQETSVTSYSKTTTLE